MNNVVIFYEGSFGAEVAKRLSRRSNVAAHRLTESVARFDEFVAGADYVCAALWRRYPGQCDELDAACHRRAIPWSTAVLEGTALQNGPVIVPGASVCWACYRKRWLTHATALDRELAIEKTYESDRLIGSAGFTPAAVSAAAAGLMLDYAERTHAAGRIRQWNLLTGSVEDTRVVRVHACPRCSRPEPGLRYVKYLVPALEEVLA